MFKSNTVGEKEFSLERRTRDGKYLEIDVVKTIKFAILVEDVVAEVHVTHIGPKGMIRFEFDGSAWECENPSFQRADSVALNESRTRAIYCRDLTYDREEKELDELQDGYYQNKEKAEDLWLELPQNYGTLPA